MSSTGRRMFAGIPTMPFSIIHRPPPPPREVHFWCLFPHEVQDASLLNLYKTFLSSEEYAQVLQMDGKQIQKQALLARVLVRTTLARYAAGQISPKSLKFTKNKFGKPEVIWPSDISYDEGKPPYLCFNLAHTSSLICCGVTTKSSLGIDVEEKGRRMSTNILAFAKRYFSSPEIAWLDAFTDPEEQRQKFIQLWTLKEAYVKALGRGISGAPLRDFSIHIKRCPVMDKHIELHENAGLIAIDQMIKLEVLRKNDAMTTGWQFLLVQPTNMHYASVCVEQAEKGFHEDEARQMIYRGLKMQIWKTVPLIMDEPMPVKEAVIASTNICSF